jgi:hypothetical protein
MTWYSSEVAFGFVPIRSPVRRRMKLAQRAGLVAGPGHFRSPLRSNGITRVGPSSWRWCGKSASGTRVI